MRPISLPLPRALGTAPRLRGGGAPVVAVGDRAAGRQALGELRRLLAILRTDGHDDGALNPQPGLDRLDEIVADAHGAGVEVNVTADGDLQGVPPA